MADEKWFLGRVSRQKAEDLINNVGIDGSFVIRSSESIPGAYALSILFKGSVHTYRVLPADGLLAVQTINGVQQRKFSTLSDLVREYRNPQNGLVCGLTNPVGLESSRPPKLLADPSHSRESLPLPPPPSPAPTPVSRHKQGIKVLPTVDAPSVPAEKTRETRNLPPVPLGDGPQRAAPKPSSSASSSADVNNKDVEIKSKFVTRLNDIKNTWPYVDSSFLETVKQYTSEGLASDLFSVGRGGSQCAELQTLLAREAVTFHSELENFLMKIDILRQLFDFSSPPRKSHAYNRMQDTDVDLDTFLGRLGDCQTVVKSLNRRACINLQDLLGISNTSVAQAWPRKHSKPIVALKERTFEVKQDGGIRFSKQKLKVDIANGKLQLIKMDGMTKYDHTQVLQIIKNNKSKSKLSIVFEGNKKRDFSFEESEQREAFCQLMQHLRNKLSRSKDPDNIKIFCGSWNMGDAIPPNDISSWFTCSGTGKCLDASIQAIPHDIYVIGTQETGLPEKDWMHRVMDTIQEITATNFHLVAMDALWHIKIIILVKEEHKNRISHVQTSSVKTGIANALGNKGAVAVSFQFGGTSFCFINAHLTSGAEKCGRRNQNYHDILRSLNLGEDRFRSFDLTNRFDHLYFLGDLNYRLEMDVQEILSNIRKNEMAVLHKVDQLRREKDSNKVFNGFHEEEILFPPTYRYERGTREAYSHLKVKKTGIRINVPSWCDRVLWRSYPETHNVCLAYGCSDDVMTSDHSPLFSNFQVGVRGQYVSNEGISNSSIVSAPASITFERMEVILKAPGKSSFYLQFHSVCLTDDIKSNRNNKLESSKQGVNCVRLQWFKENLPQLKPIISDREYLIDQHILVSVRAEDDSEVHAECVIALRSMIGISSQPFAERLTRKGEEKGDLRGSMTVKASGESKLHVEKTYDFIRRDDDEMKKTIQIQDVIYEDPVANPPSTSFPNPPSTSFPNPPARSKPKPPSHQVSNIEQQKSGFTPEVAVYGESLITEGEYADPDMVNPKPHINNPPTLPAPNGRRSPAKTTDAIRPSIPIPDIRPTEYDSPRPSNFGDLQKNLDKSQVTFPPDRPAPAPRAVSGSIFPQLPLIDVQSSQPPPRTTTRQVKSTSNLEDVLEEFKKVEDIFNDALSPTFPIAAFPPQTASASPSSSALFPPGNDLSQSNTYDVPLGFMKRVNNSPGTSRPSSRPHSQGYDQASALRTPPAASAAMSRAVPGSVYEFLSSCNLEQYTEGLQENGWDSIEFLSDITEDDLMESGITDPRHCSLILERIQSLAL
ncbi:phosphatidylinositol 3,4,5-trisphosphate 5-phosphatase 2-like isoform X1 [Clavelina lepadiformis]|uniref:phosphatidylinositol 3,4,5-trisphosphate 5-phosphatase 2-like isoform X1 n=1 Tax=Clavelina lepadiformis TaxID=159417 RepID=UPI00404104F8